MSWIGIVFLYTFGGEILYGIRHDTFIDEEECRSHYESLNNWNYVGKHTNMYKMPGHIIQYETPIGNAWVLCEAVSYTHLRAHET